VAAPAAPPPPAAPAAPVPPPGALLGGQPPADESIRTLLSASRTLALLFALLAGVLFLVFLAFAFLDLFLGRGAGDIIWAVYSLASAAVNYLLWREIPRLEQLAAARQYAALRDQTVVWAVLGVVFFVLVGVLLLVVWMRTELVIHPSPS
jgi:hypothetical protein